MATRRWRPVPAHRAGPPRRPRAAPHRHLGGRRLPQRRQRRVVAGEQRRHRRRVMPDSPTPEFGQCVHKVARDAADPERLYLQHHGGIYRSDDGGGSWAAMTGIAGMDFGFPVVAHPTRPDTAYLLPLESDEFRCTPEGRCVVWRTTDRGASWLPLTDGLPQQDAHLTALCDGFTTDGQDPAGPSFGTRSGEVYGLDRRRRVLAAARQPPPPGPLGAGRGRPRRLSPWRSPSGCPAPSVTWWRAPMSSPSRSPTTPASPPRPCSSRTRRSRTGWMWPRAAGQSLSIIPAISGG